MSPTKLQSRDDAGGMNTSDSSKRTRPLPRRMLIGVYGSTCFWPVSEMAANHVHGSSGLDVAMRRKKARILGFSPLVALSSVCPSYRCVKLLHLPALSLRHVPSHLAHGCPGSRCPRLPLRACACDGSTPVPLHRSHGFGSRPTTGENRARTYTHASHTWSECGEQNDVWSVSDEPMNSHTGLPHVLSPPHTAHGSASCAAQPSTAGRPT